MERIRPPYRPEDDQPFGGERWGCFWLAAIIIGLWVVYVVLSLLLISNRFWLVPFRFVILIIDILLIGSFFRKKFRR